MFLDGSEKCARSTIQTLVAPDCMANHAKKNARSIHSLNLSIMLTVALIGMFVHFALGHSSWLLSLNKLRCQSLSEPAERNPRNRRNRRGWDATKRARLVRTTPGVSKNLYFSGEKRQVDVRLQRQISSMVTVTTSASSPIRGRGFITGYSATLSGDQSEASCYIDLD